MVRYEIVIIGGGPAGLAAAVAMLLYLPWDAENVREEP